MKKIVWCCFCFIVNALHGQDVQARLSESVKQMEADTFLRHAIVALCVVESNTGKTVYEHNAQVGLAPASTQKLFTSCAAFDLLGKDFRYTTEVGYKNLRGVNAGHFLISSSGDPSFGSSRFSITKPVVILNKIVAAMRDKKIKGISESVQFNPLLFDDAIPGGWMWEDIGNYYGAAAQSFNWLENQYDLKLKSGSKPGDTAVVTDISPKEANLMQRKDFFIDGSLKAAEKASGDNTIIYLPYHNQMPVIEGTIPPGENGFEVSGSITNPSAVFGKQLINAIKNAGIVSTGDGNSRHTNPSLEVPDAQLQYTSLYKHLSPPFDSLNYWFLKKSINLYGEAFIKTMAYQQTGKGSTEKGVALLKDYWQANGIEKSAVNICDGSGLSPQNRVTAGALVKVLQYARTRTWYTSFYYDLPEYNGMKMKSGSINGARAYAGYHTAANGKEYTFAMIVNNYDGTGAATVRKMYRVLDQLK